MPNQHNEQLPPEVERYLALCQRAYQRMVDEGKWPWPDDPPPATMLELEDNQNDV